MNKIFIFVVIFIGIILIGFFVWPKFFRVPEQIACTMEAKLCPDGSSVGRSGPKCEFAKCPNTETNISTNEIYITPIVVKETGTISGTVTTSPTCPVERVPPEPGCAPKPFVTSIEIRQIGNTILIKTIKSNASGKFNTELSVGSYELKPVSGFVFPRCASVTVQVKSGQNSIADISCDTGIR